MAKQVSPTSIRDVLENWSAADGPLYQRLARGLRTAIDELHLEPGTMLPPERSIAATLGISRSTVVGALESLKKTGHLEARQGSGTWVRERQRPLDEGNIELVEELEDHAIVRNISGAPSQVIAFAAAAVDCAPEVNEALLSLSATDLARWSGGNGYRPQGDERLRDLVARHLENRGVSTTPEQVLITAGATQAIALVTRLYIQSGASAIVETPTYGGALDMLHTAGARPITIDVDADGAQTTQLAELLPRLKPRIVYLIPDFHNPTGVVMSAERREHVAQLACEHRVPIVEDLALRGLWFDGPAPPPIASYNPAAPVLTIGTLSKVLWAGLRVGWVRASEETIARLARLKVVDDFGTPVIMQALATRLLPHFEAVAERRRGELQRNFAALQAAGACHLPGWEFNRPAGGLAVWAKLPAPKAEDLARRAPAFGVEVVPGFAFAVEHHRHPDRVRLPITASPAVIEEGIRRIAQAWDDLERTGGSEAAPVNERDADVA